MAVTVNPNGIGIIWFNNDVGIIDISPIAQFGEMWIGIDIAHTPIKNTTAFNTGSGLSAGYVAVGNSQR